MGCTSVERIIRAPAERVFATVAEIENYSEAVPHIVEVEFLTDQHTGVGTRFRETRLMGKRRATSVLEVTEFEPPSHVRLVSDQGGTVWDTVFSVEPAGEGAVRLAMVMDARANRFAAKLFNPLVAGVIRKAIEKDMDAVKAYCERE